MQNILRNILRIGLPLVLGGAILWWMYRGFRWDEVREAVSVDMRWGWMVASLPFGVLAQVFRGLRWRQMLLPLGERVSRWSCVRAVFLSYASSLVVPRVGELLRCGVLARDADAKVSRSLGTVVTERVVDIVLILMLTVLTVALQVPFFVRFMGSTGFSLQGMAERFTPAGWWVTVVCGMVAVATGGLLLRRFRVFEKSRRMTGELIDGLLSIRRVERKGLFWFYSLGIWVAYFLHFYLTFFCFAQTATLGLTAALIAFVVGTFAVLVPTPNGAGPWHFAVKTVLVLYGVAGTTGALFVLVVHSIQTLLVAVLGLVGLYPGKKRKL